MFWLFAMALTAGLVLGVPVLLQTLDGAASSSPSTQPDATRPRDVEATVSGFAGGALTAAGLGGLLALAFDPAVWVAVAVAACLGLAAGAVHPEILAAVARRRPAPSPS